MNQIVKHAGMVRVTSIDCFKEFCCLFLLLKACRTFRDSAKNREAIEQSGFVVPILSISGGHRVSIMLIACGFVSCARVSIESRYRCKIKFLARRSFWGGHP